MAYENGRQIKAYAKKRQHKEKQKKTFLEMYSVYFTSDLDTYIEEEKRKEKYWRNDGKYWRRWYLSGRRKYARQCTHEKARQELLKLKHTQNFDDVPCMKNSTYNKGFDYAWTIW